MAKRQKNWPQILAKVLATNISQCDIVIVCLAVLVQVPFFLPCQSIGWNSLNVPMVLS